MSHVALVVEDERDINHLVCTTLRLHGIESLAAHDGPEGLRVARTQPVDLVLLDVMMPGMDGYEVLRQLKSDPTTSHLPVVFLSAKVQRKEIEQGLRLGAEKYLSKPFDPMELAAEILEVLNSQVPVGNL